MAGSGDGDRADAARPPPKGFSRRDFLRTSLGAALALPGAAALVAADQEPARAGSFARRWYKTDTHVHSVWSADAYNDFGIITAAAKANRYDALIMSDHDSASSFPVSGQTANRFVLDSLARWTPIAAGNLSASTNALVTSPVKNGEQALQISATSSTRGEVGQWGRRGPNLRAGNARITFFLRPARIDPGCGFYVSVALGGDPSIAAPDGYTTSSGVVTPGKSIVFVWQTGSVRTPSSDPSARVFVTSLSPPPALDVWTSYTINLTQALSAIPTAEMPLDYNGFLYPKIAVVANAGTVEVFVDSYVISTSTPRAPAQEFVYRTSIVNAFDTSSFLSFPALEMGVSEHAQRFEFGITQASDFVTYSSGVNGIPTAQARGYPAQLNHPGSPGGLSSSQTVSTKAANAEMIEVRDPAWKSLWDKVLNQGVPLIGTWSTDAHTTIKKGNTATYLHATGLTFDALMRELFEGRCYCAVNDFPGRIIFNVDGSSDPYPARYPTYVSDAQTSAVVHLLVTGGLSDGASIVWVGNGEQIGTSAVSSSTFDGSKVIPLRGAFTYARGEVKNASGSLKGLTQAIFFVSTPGLPAGWSYRVRSIQTANGRSYTNRVTKGITSSAWHPTGRKLSMKLTDPVGAVVELEIPNDAGAPRRVLVDGVSVPAATSRAEFAAAAASTWFVDAGGILRVKARHATTSAAVVVDWPATSPPDSSSRP